MTIAVPRRGEQAKLTEMCRNNAAEHLAQSSGRTGRETSALDELARLLGLEKPPMRIESYDISNLAGGENVAGMVVFENGRPKKSDYRRFQIRTVSGQDDYGSMAEVLTRRFREYQTKKEEGDPTGFGALPDLILLDGGKGHVDIDRLTARVKDLLAELKNPDLRNLADTFVSDEAFMQAFCNRPAGIKIHHAVIGGLLEHTLKMMEMAKNIGRIYSNILDPDLLLMGAFLHDIGKIDELSSKSGFSYTDMGQMLGHPHLGAARLREKIAETEKLTATPFDPELAMLLTHLIISHHGTLENGSAKVPMTLEAIALYYIDSLDAKLAEFHRNLCEDVNSDSHWTNYIPGLDRKLYKNRN